MLDRDALWAVYDRYSMPNDVQEERGLGFDAFVQEVEAAVRPAVIDRDALRRGLVAVIDGEWHGNEGDGEIADHMIDVFLALVRPVAGVMLTPEEAALAAYAVRGDLEAEDFGDNAELERNLRALAARLEAAS